MSRLFALIVLAAVIATASAQYYYSNGYYGSGLGYGYSGLSSYGYAPAVGYASYGYGYPSYGYGYYKK